jgi:hypothetical protein
MGKITLHVKDADMHTVVDILKNLKEGLIQNIETEDIQTQVRPTQYQPKSDTIIAEGEKPNGKYLSAAAYKTRLKKTK